MKRLFKNGCLLAVCFICLLLCLSCSRTDGRIIEAAHDECVEHRGVSELWIGMAEYNVYCLDGTLIKNIGTAK